MNLFRSRAEQARATAAAEVEREYRSRRSTVLADQATELEQAAVRFDDAVTAHAAAEQREGKRLATIAKTLNQSAGKLAGAQRAADAALAALIDAADEHDQAVEQSRRELLAAGLRAEYQDTGEVVSFAVGAVPSGVQLPDKTWTRINPAQVLVRAAYGALRSIGHRPAETWRFQYRTDLLDALLPPLPPAHRPAAPEWRSALATAHAAALARPGPTPAQIEAAADAQRRAEHEEKQLDARARRAYGEAREDMVGRIGEQAVQELEIRHALPLFAPRTSLDEVVSA